MDFRYLTAIPNLDSDPTQHDLEYSLKLKAIIYCFNQHLLILYAEILEPMHECYCQS